MKKVFLHSDWQYSEREPQSIDAQAVNLPGESSDWEPIAVPGDINIALRDCGRIPDPHFNTNGRECYWVTAKEWWYKLDFDCPETDFANVDLCFYGADGTADVWLNDRYLGEMKNCFREHRFRLQQLIKPKDNCLCVRFRSLDQFFGGAREDELAGWRGKRAFLRKPQYTFGWDWALPLPSIGLGGEVWLEFDSCEKFVDVSLQTDVSGRIDFAFEVTKAVKDAEYEILVTVSGHGVDYQHKVAGIVMDPYTGHGADGSDARSARYKTYCHVDIPDPKLWYPNGFGDQALYDYRAELITNGRTVDIRDGKVGIREVKVIETPFREESGPGYAYEFEVNGQRVFCKGANWIPLEFWPAEATDDKYEFLVRSMKDANFNMIRVWGGGIYEKEIFYKLCDEMGIMVWQDFMFASTGYPVDYLREEIRKEAEFQLRRLRNHCSIAIWCGCNEDVYAWQYPEERADVSQMDTGVYNEDADKSSEKWQFDRLHDDPEIYSMILRGLVSLLGQGIPYVESSPASRDDFGNIPSSGNCHISSWKYVLLQSGDSETFREYFKQICSFNSEFCIEGPDYAWSIRKFMAPENHWPPNESWVYHCQRGHKNLPHYEQHIRIAEGLFGKIHDLDEYAKFGQATHIEMMRVEFEFARRNRPDCGGTMVWMLHDCWPTSNWSIINYYRVPKPSYYSAKRACAPLLPIIAERHGIIDFNFSNESAKAVDVKLTYGQERLDGETVWQKEATFVSAANTSLKFDTLPKNSVNNGAGDYLYIQAVVDGQAFDKITYFPHYWRQIEWPDVSPEVKVLTQTRKGDRFETELEVSTDNYLRLFHLVPRDNEVLIDISDNYFDLCAGQSKVITLSSAKDIQLADLKILHWQTSWE